MRGSVGAEEPSGSMMRASILRAGVFAVALATAAGGASARSEFDTGMFAYLRGDYAAALDARRGRAG